MFLLHKILQGTNRELGSNLSANSELPNIGSSCPWTGPNEGENADTSWWPNEISLVSYRRDDLIECALLGALPGLRAPTPSRAESDHLSRDGAGLQLRAGCGSGLRSRSILHLQAARPSAPLPIRGKSLVALPRGMNCRDLVCARPLAERTGATLG